jgi:hypothetical protein
MDDWEDCKNEYRRSIYFTAVLGLALGNLGYAAKYTDHRHYESRIPKYQATATFGGTAGRIEVFLLVNLLQ